MQDKRSPAGSGFWKRLSAAYAESASRLVGHRLARTRLRQKLYPRIAEQYPHIHIATDWREDSIMVPGNESGRIVGWVVRASGAVPRPVGSVLLAGEAASAKPIYAGMFGIAEDQVATSGLAEDADSQWNFEQPPPGDIGPFDCIVSYAILEHLTDPFGHVRDLAGLLADRGELIIYTVTPGFPYHRHPVDCQRFFPDWFEGTARRLNLEVKDAWLGDDHIVYRLAQAT
jgi:hypothetical protein